MQSTSIQFLILIILFFQFRDTFSNDIGEYLAVRCMQGAADLHFIYSSFFNIYSKIRGMSVCPPSQHTPVLAHLSYLHTPCSCTLRILQVTTTPFCKPTPHPHSTQLPYPLNQSLYFHACTSNFKMCPTFLAIPLHYFGTQIISRKYLLLQ